MRLLILGVSGMLGSAMFRLLSLSEGLDVFGCERGDKARNLMHGVDQSKLISGVDVTNWASVCQAVADTRPHVLINCVGVVKQLRDAEDPLVTLPINSLLPHQLNALCSRHAFRLIHISTDCVFSGRRGSYVETDEPDARDLYGLSKYLGELNTPGAVTLRTSIIGHELDSHHGLIGWFLCQNEPVRGFKRAIFSGLPTVELAAVVRDFVLPNDRLHGLYHVSAEPISKFELLRLVAKEYRKNVEIMPDETLDIDRSLNSDKFRAMTGYVASAWPELIRRMHQFG